MLEPDDPSVISPDEKLLINQYLNEIKSPLGLSRETEEKIKMVKARIERDKPDDDMRALRYIATGKSQHVRTVEIKNEKKEGAPTKAEIHLAALRKKLGMPEPSKEAL